MNAMKISHAARRWALRATKYNASGPREIWWVGTGFVEDEDICGLYTHAKAKEILDWLCSNEGITSRLDGYTYAITRVR